MKCVESPKGQLKRVSDVEAQKLVEEEGYKFVPKSKWKTKEGRKAGGKENG